MAPHSNRSATAEAVILVLPSLVALLMGWVSGYEIDAAASVLLVMPVTLASHFITRLLSRRFVGGAFFGLLLGVLLRATVIIVGGMVLFLKTDWFRARGVSLWVWVIGVYLSTLALEIALLASSAALRHEKRHGGSR